ncbi:MAG: RNA-binding protein [Thermoplasmata archaeon]|nr:RNA-binding protein [Thermoplasmata archaeon]
MVEMRHRQRVREKEAKRLSAETSAYLGCEINFHSFPLDVAEFGELKVLMHGQRVVGFFVNEIAFPSLRLLQEINPEKKFVEVDSGAVRFLVNGADVMKPGITLCDGEIKEGDAVWVREATHKKAIVVGIALESGETLGNREKGKGVKTVHWVGDKLWEMW